MEANVIAVHDVLACRRTFLEVRATKKGLRRTKSCGDLPGESPPRRSCWADVESQDTERVAFVEEMRSDMRWAHREEEDDPVIATLHALAKCSSFTAVVEPTTVEVCKALLPRVALANFLEHPRLQTKTLWSLGKLNAIGTVVGQILGKVAIANPKLHSFSTVDLVSILWSLARITKGCDADSERIELQCERPIKVIAKAIVNEALVRVEQMNGRCLSNSIWALAKLNLRTTSARRYAELCMLHMSHHCLCSLSPQGVANGLWAAARLAVAQDKKLSFCETLARHAAPQAQLFKSHELSMAVWGAARIIGRTRCAPTSGVVQFAEAVAVEASERLNEMSPQSISNIAWALASLQLLSTRKQGPALKFLLTMVEGCGPNLQSFHPQAISNMSWAISKVSRATRQAFDAFASFAIREATSKERVAEFTWQDLVTLASAISKFHLVERRGLTAFVQRLAQSASLCAHDIDTQPLLNLGLAISTVAVDADTLWDFRVALESTISSRPLNKIDLHQLTKIRCACVGRCVVNP